jgi:hypothetical protein
MSNSPWVTDKVICLRTSFDADTTKVLRAFLPVRLGQQQGLARLMRGIIAECIRVTCRRFRKGYV